MFINQGYKANKVLYHCKISSSTWYSRKKGRGEDQRKHNKGRPIPGYSINPDGTLIPDNTIINVLKRMREMPEFSNGGGYHKLVHYLERDYNIFVNHKKLYRICSENHFLLPRKKKNKRHGKKISENRIINGPNQLWQFDIKYGYIHGENRFFFLMAFIDVFYKKVIDFHVGLHCKASDIQVTLDLALEKSGAETSNLVIRSDNGPQMTSYMFRKHIDEINIEHEFTPCQTPNKNAFIESFFSIIEVEFLQVNYFNSFAEAYKKIIWFIDFYNTYRLHGSLKNRSPEEFKNDWTDNKVMNYREERA